MNYHGPYILTRLLEPVLIASKPSRVVNVASVQHRIGYITDIRKFMFDAKKFLYSETKLGNVLLTYEHQRRLGSHGVQVCLYFNTAMTFAHLHYPPPHGPDPGPGLSTSTASVIYQYCLCCLPVLPLLSTSAAFLVYQYCLCCPPVLPLLSTSTAFVVHQQCLPVCHWTQVCCFLTQSQSTSPKPFASSLKSLLYNAHHSQLTLAVLQARQTS